MTPSQIQLFRELRNAGYAVIIWTPEELGDLDPQKVEDCSISYVNEYLIKDTEE